MLVTVAAEASPIVCAGLNKENKISHLILDQEKMSITLDDNIYKIDHVIDSGGMFVFVTTKFIDTQGDVVFFTLGDTNAHIRKGFMQIVLFDNETTLPVAKIDLICQLS